MTFISDGFDADMLCSTASARVAKVNKDTDNMQKNIFFIVLFRNDLYSLYSFFVTVPFELNFLDRIGLPS